MPNPNTGSMQRPEQNVSDHGFMYMRANEANAYMDAQDAVIAGLREELAAIRGAFGNRTAVEGLSLPMAVVAACQEAAKAGPALGSAKHWEFHYERQKTRAERAEAALADCQRRERESGWVSVEERLPPEGTEVLCTGFAWSNPGAPRWYTNCLTDNGKLWDGNVLVIATHWRPLQPAPQAAEASAQKGVE